MKNVLVFSDHEIKTSGISFPDEVPVKLNFGQPIYTMAKMSRQGEDIIAEFTMLHPLPEFYDVAPGGKILETDGNVITKYEIFEVSLIPKRYITPKTNETL